MNIINDMLVDKCFPDNPNARAVVPAYKDKTLSGNPITLTDSAENKPLGMKLYGWSKQDDEPSPDNPVEIESAGMKWSTGAQLFDINGEIGYTYITNTNNKDNIVDGKVITVNSNSSGKACAGVKIAVKPSTTYCFSCDVLGFGTGIGVYLGVNDNAPNRELFGTNTLGHATLKITTNDDDTELVFGFATINGKGAQVTNVMLNEGTEEATYEPYTGGITKPYGDKIGITVSGTDKLTQSTSIITPNGLPGIPVPSNTAGITYTDADGQAWIVDEIDLERGEYVQRINTVELTGNEQYNVSTETYYTGTSAGAWVGLKKTAMNKNALCNALNKVDYVWSIPSAVGYTINANSKFHIRLPKDLLGVSDEDDIPTISKAIGAYCKKMYENGDPITLKYILATPIECDLTSAELAEYTQLYSYKPTTVVENDSGCWMDVTYKAGTSGKSKNEALRWYFKNVMPLVE